MSVRPWVIAARVQTLPAAVVPVLVGSAVAWERSGSFRLDVFLAALAVALLLQVAANLANDYGDFRKGADTAARLGPTRVTQSGLLSPRRVRDATVLVLALAIPPGAYLVAIGGWPLLALGLAAIASAVLYTAGPWPLAYHGLGELFVFVFFGLVAVVGTAYLHAGSIEPLDVAAAVAVGAVAVAILVVNNLRDLDTDRVAGKRTLAVRLGQRATRAEYVALLAVAYAVPVLLWVGLSAWVLLPLLSLPLAVRLAARALRDDGRALNALLRDTARLHLVFGLLLSAGLAL